MRALHLLEKICGRFHLMVRQLRDRYADRISQPVDDEYDVQDLLHAVLRLFFDDVRNEEWTPSYAGGSSRIDFILKAEKLAIEVKKTRKGLGPKELGEQLIIDIAKYKEHPDCSHLYCFVYDSDGFIPNPQGIEGDLSRGTGELPVTVLIVPKGY